MDTDDRCLICSIEPWAPGLQEDRDAYFDGRFRDYALVGGATEDELAAYEQLQRRIWAAMAQGKDVERQVRRWGRHVDKARVVALRGGAERPLEGLPATPSVPVRHLA